MTDCDSKRSPVRVRFAPSPTGLLHIGGARTALFNWLLAHGQARREERQTAFLLRIEDTDRNRYVEGAEEGIVDILRWFGLDWDEGPDTGGPLGPYRQSERTDLYRQHADQLLETGHAYRCFCTSERLQRVREEQTARKEAPGYDRFCRDLTAQQVQSNLAAGMPFSVRFRMPLSGETPVVDLLRGEIVFQNANLEDLILLKSDGYPTYHLANVVDDHLMAISHILRGEEWIPTAPIHVRLYAAFGWDVPQFAHLPLILAPGGGKLSKRHGSTAMEEFRTQGYLPEALMNYLALLGWSLDGTTELFSRDDLLETFTLERVNPSPGTFDYNKLRWFNQQYINHVLTLDELTLRVMPFLSEAELIAPGPFDTNHPDFSRIQPVVALLKDRLETLAEAPDLMTYFLQPELEPYDPALLVPKKMTREDALVALEAVTALLSEVDLDDEETTEVRFRTLADELGLKPGSLFMPVRVAVTGRTQSPGLFETLRVIGGERVRARVAGAIERLRDWTPEEQSAETARVGV
ncbi:MAG TPA: glutamate--tRNA ligase [Thermomicrobiales bacterium]|nr:glutamate--tRNA ligase [Thermomicrobiales bacterium]